jgi:hypothetical protein
MSLRGEKVSHKILKFSVLALVLLSISLVVGPVIAQDADAETAEPVNVTFTKWVTTPPSMEGVVGGDVGDGAFVGEVLNLVPGDVITNIEALYHINGDTHTFTAHMFVWMNVVTKTAEVRGVVTEGWLAGSLVGGTFTIISCPDKTDGLCYEGELHIDSLSELPEASE